MSCRTSIIGVGGAGCRIVGQMIESPQSASKIVALDTDAKSLAETRAMVKLQIGSGHAQGLGAAGDMNLGRLAAEDDIEMIRNVFADDPDIVFLVAGLGGGTGTGAAPVVLRAAHDAGAMTVCFAALPFRFEGGQRETQAGKGMAALREYADALVLISNDDLFQFIGEGSIAETFRRADEVVGEGVCAIWKTIAESGYFNPDFADVQKMLRHCGGACTFGYGFGAGPDRASAALNMLRDGALLKQGSVLDNARAVLVSVCGGDDLGLKEVRDIRERLAAGLRDDCLVLFGTAIDNAWRDKCSVTVLASEEWLANTTGELALGDEPVHRRKNVDAQGKLTLEVPVSPRFKGAEPTILDGEDLDIPTYIRRRISISR